MRVLEATAEPVSAGEIARHSRKERQIEKRVGLAVAALARLGHLSAAEDGREGLAARRGVDSGGFARQRCIKER